MLDITVLDEPELEFRYGQKLTDPKNGLAIFGAYDLDRASWPGQIPYAVIGTATGIGAFREFAAALDKPIVSQKFVDPAAELSSRLLWPPFPGFSAIFGANWVKQAAWSRPLDETKLLSAARHNDKYQRAFDATNLYLDAIATASRRDEKLGVIVCVVPDEVWLNCRPLSRVNDGIGFATSKAERRQRRQQLDLLTPYYPEQYDLSVDFRRQLKARAMEHHIPIQLVRESTLLLRDTGRDDSRQLTPLSDRAWNLATALYYKAGGKPWRLASARPGVCYVGISFRRSELDDDNRTACCAAQMFLDTGDGVVFQGEYGPWYSLEDDACHLTRDAAFNLLTGVLKEYAQLNGGPLREIFLHSRSAINQAEWEGYVRACPAGVKLTGIRVRMDRDGVRLYRDGDWPVLRGTTWVVGDRQAYLWGSGFKPSVMSYDGWEIPVPLRIDLQHGSAAIREVARDILGLTKLNFNATKLGDSEPVTIGFSDQVGEILVGNPKTKVRLPSFRFYI